MYMNWHHKLYRKRKKGCRSRQDTDYTDWIGNVVERLQIVQMIQSRLLLITDYTEKK